MEVFLNVATQLSILFLVMGLGVILRKIGLLNDSADRVLSAMVIKVALPGMILSSVLSNTDLPDASTVGLVMLISAIVYTVVCPLAWLTVRYLFRGAQLSAKGAYAFLMAFGNTGFIGFPLINAVFGSDAVLFAAIYNIPFNFFMFSIGILYFTKTSATAEQKSAKEQAREIARELLSPVMISCVIAMILALLNVTDSGIVGQTCDLVGQMTVPGAMILIGSALGKQSPRQMIGDPWIYLSSLVRLVAIPLTIWFAGSFLGINTTILAIVTLVCATPVASIGTALAINYNGDTEAMARGTFISTLLSLITLPLIATLVL